MSEYCIILTTTNKENAKQIADKLVKDRLAACVQMTGMNSVYEWKGEVCYDEEILMFIKTREALYAKCCEVIQSIHDYEVPEILKLNIDGGNEEYLKWILMQTK